MTPLDFWVYKSVNLSTLLSHMEILMFLGFQIFKNISPDVIFSYILYRYTNILLFFVKKMYGALEM